MEGCATASAGGTTAGEGRPASARTLLSGAVDYAGLFPPAARSMPQAVAEYATARAGPDAWMLGRFVLPAADLPGFAAARAAHAAPADVWRLSAIVRDVAEPDREAIAAFNAASAGRYAVVDTVEGKPQTLEGIGWLAEAFGGAFDVYVEVGTGDEAGRWLDAAAAHGLKAKVRTGGLTPAAFPTPAALVSFIDTAVRLKVPFKATAGLHHAIRGSYRLTYEDDAPHAPMYGYLNVLLATAVLRAGLPLSLAEAIVRLDDATSLAFSDDGVRWRDIELPVSILRSTRAEHLVSFGSCSFREPVDELQRLIPNR